MSYRLRKSLSVYDVRRVCIEHDYYTRGDNKAYEEMFRMLDNKSRVTGSNISAYRLEMIAEDIKAHSNTEDTVEDIMSALAVHINVSFFNLHE